MTRIVVRSPDWLGDAVMALPAIRSVRRHYPDAVLCVAAVEGLAPLFRCVPEVDEVVGFAAGARSERAALASTRADIGILLKNAFGSAWRLYRARVGERWGYSTEARGVLLTRGVARRTGRRARDRHQSAYYLELMRGLAIPPGPLDAHVVVPDRARTAARAQLDLAGIRPAADRAPLVVLAPGAAYGGAKRWPPEYVARLIGELVRQGASCVLVGSAADRRTGIAVEQALAPDVAGSRGGAAKFANLIGQTDLLGLIGVLAAADVVVSNDSGAMHLAAAAGRPVVALFGSTNEKATSPLGRHQLLLEPVACRPCMLPECPIDHRCMRRITPDRVLEAVRGMMTAPPAASSPEVRLKVSP